MIERYIKRGYRQRERDIERDKYRERGEMKSSGELGVINLEFIVRYISLSVILLAYNIL